MFSYKASNSMCRYFPHLSLKEQPLYEFLTFKDNPQDAVYVLECAAGPFSTIVLHK